MPDVDFAVTEAVPQPYAAAPLLVFKLRIATTEPATTVDTVALRCQIQIEATRRQYSPADQRRLRDLFGDAERWAQTLRTTLWTHATVVVPRFTGESIVDLPVPCSFDFNVAATKLFAGLDDGDVPLCLQFSGTVFYENERGALQVSQIPWHKEARFRLPVRVWQDMMDLYYPNSAWLCLRRDVFDRIHEFKMRSGLPTWEEAVERLLEGVEAEAEP